MSGDNAADVIAKRALSEMSLGQSMEALALSDEWAIIEAAMGATPAVVVPVEDQAPWLAVVQKRAGMAPLPIVDTSRAKQIVYCVGLEPDAFDFHNDTISAEEIEKTAHSFLEESRIIGRMHSHKINATPVESYIAPQDLEFEGPNGRQRVTKGSWVLGIKIRDPVEWRKVLDGEYTGISVGGLGRRQIIEETA